MNGQITITEYIKNRDSVAFSCSQCVCRSCLYWWSQRCPHGGCWDDHRAKVNPYDKAHPEKPPRTLWSNWDKPGEQAHWCRGGSLYPVSYCEHFAKYQGSQIKTCLKCNVQIFQDGHINCSLLENFGCEKCYEEWEGIQCTKET